MGLLTETQREAIAREEHASMRQPLSDLKMYHPVFCLVEVWDAYWLKIASNNTSRRFGGDCYLEISSVNNTSFEAMQERHKEARETRFDNPSDIDFVGQTVDQVYTFYKEHLRPADNSRDLQNFSAFTFAAVDELCLNSEPQQLIICSDAPDFGEEDDERVLKQVRVEATRAWYASSRIEDLTWTPKEAEAWKRDPENKDLTMLSLGPLPPKLVDYDDQIVGGGWKPYVPARMRQARAKKRAAIKSVQSKGWIIGKGWPAGTERLTVPVEE